MSIVKIRGIGERIVKCDVLIADITIEVENNNSSFAVKTVDERLEVLLKYLEDNGLEPKKLKLKHTSIEKRYSSEKYTAKKTIELRSELNMQLNNFLYKLPKQFDFDLELNIDYEVKDTTKIVTEVMQEAFQDSQNKAEIFAKAANKQIVGFETLEYCNRNSYSAEREVVPAWSRYGSLAKSVTVEVGDELSPDTERISEYVEVNWIVE